MQAATLDRGPIRAHGSSGPVFERLEASGFRELKVHLTEEARAHAFAAAVSAQFTASVGYCRGERSGAAANPLIGDLDPTSLPGPRPRDHGRPQATTALGALRMTR